MTTLTAAPSRAGMRATTTNFYLGMALSCAAVAFLGFAPTFWFPLAAHSFKANPIIYVHGAVFFGWTLFFCYQTWLASSGRVRNHRAAGLIGVSFATAMTIFGTLAAINSMKMAALGGMTDAGIAFSIVPLSGIAFFAVVFALAVINVRNVETHKRLMLLAGISILDAAVARWFIFFLAPPGAAGPPPVAVTIPPALVAYLLLVVAIVFDWRTRGRPHPVYIYGGLALVALKLLNLPISMSAGWHAFAGGLLALAQ